LYLTVALRVAMVSNGHNTPNNEAFLKLFLKHENGLRSYIRSCVADVHAHVVKDIIS